MRGCRARVGAITSLLVASAAHGQGTPGFYGIPEGEAAVDVSSGGLVLISGYRGGDGSALWTPSDGVVRGGVPDYPVEVSLDGFYVAGNEPAGPYRWDEQHGVEIIPPLDGGTDVRRAVAIDGVGVHIVGNSTDRNGGRPDRAWRSVGADEPEDLGSLIFDGTSRASDISSDRRFIVGVSESLDPLGSEAFIWEDGSGMRGIGNLGSQLAEPLAVSDDGSTVAGFARAGGAAQAFVWTEAGGMVGLGDLNNVLEPASAAQDVSADGRVVVGEGRDGSGQQRAFIWTPDSRMQDLEELLSLGHGFDLTGWRLTRALAVSPDGRVVAGVGVFENGGSPVEAAWVAVLPLEASRFVPLGTLPGGLAESFANAISADGSTVVGRTHSSGGGEAFRWRRETGMISLGILPGGSHDIVASDVSVDGVTVTGRADDGTGVVSFLWMETRGLVSLGHPPNTAFSTDQHIAPDAGTVAFSALRDDLTGDDAWLWRNGQPLQMLPHLPGGADRRAVVGGISRSGSVVVGTGDSANGFEAFLWSSGGGIIGLGDLAGGSFLSEAGDVTPDGRVVVGSSKSSRGTEAFRWTEDSGMQGLGLLSRETSSVSRAVSASGHVVVGGGNAAGDNKAWIWDARNGIQDWPAPQKLIQPL